MSARTVWGPRAASGCEAAAPGPGYASTAGRRGPGIADSQAQGKYSFLCRPALLQMIFNTHADREPGLGKTAKASLDYLNSNLTPLKPKPPTQAQRTEGAEGNLC